MNNTHVNKIIAEIVKSAKPPSAGKVWYQLTPTSPVLTGTAISKLLLIDIDNDCCQTQITILDSDDNVIDLYDKQILSHNILVKRD